MLSLILLLSRVKKLTLENKMKIQILVEARYGEESNWVSDIDQSEFELLNPLLAEIEKRNGYFPTGDYYTYPDPNPLDLYREFPGLEILKRLLPTPLHGFGRISEVHVFTVDPISLYI